MIFDVEEDSLSAYADRDAVYQIIYNLCDNAIKFSAEDGDFRIRICKNGNSKLLVSIYNTGVGILKDDLPYVFERFYKSDKSRGLNKSGVGLGLFIAKTIVDAHGERIWVESEYGKNKSDEFLEYAEKMCEEEVTHWIRSAIKTALRINGADPFDFGRVLKRKMPEYWNAMSGDWHNEMQKCKYTAEVVMEFA